MMPTPICRIYSNLREMFVLLFTALNVQHAMNCLLIYQTRGFLVLVSCCPLLSAILELCHFTFAYVSCFSSPPAYHAGLNDKLRSSVLENWISSKIQVVVATVAFGYEFK